MQAEWNKEFILDLITQKQIDEWKNELKLVDEDFKKENIFNNWLKNKWLFEENNWLNEKYKFLPIDTKYLDEEKKIKLLSLFDNIEEKLDWLLIKSENFQALNTLLKKYKEQVKTIYIDPPYNTWNDGFVYKDNYNHSSWLSMMENRLKLAKELMNEKWVIFSSIDDNEVDNLKKLENMIFRNIKNIIWKKKWNSTNSTNFWVINEYIIIWNSKNIKANLIDENKIEIYNWKIAIFKDLVSNQREKNDYKLFFNMKDKKIIAIKNWEKNSNISDDFIEINPKEFWWWIFSVWYKTINNMIKENCIDINLEKKFIKAYFYIDLFSNQQWYLYSVINDTPYLINKNIKLQKTWTNLLSNYWFTFSYSKPYELLIPLIITWTYNWYFEEKTKDIILDFFAWSWTTADAVIRLNQEDWWNRKFILAELNEYFETIIIPRIKKVSFCNEWKNWKPDFSNKDSKQSWIFFKYIYLDQYEDILENLDLLKNFETFQEKVVYIYNKILIEKLKDNDFFNTVIYHLWLKEIKYTLTNQAVILETDKLNIIKPLKDKITEINTENWEDTYVLQQDYNKLSDTLKTKTKILETLFLLN